LLSSVWLSHTLLSEVHVRVYREGVVLHEHPTPRASHCFLAFGYLTLCYYPRYMCVCTGRGWCLVSTQPKGTFLLSSVLLPHTLLLSEVHVCVYREGVFLNERFTTRALHCFLASRHLTLCFPGYICVCTGRAPGVLY